MSPIHRVLAVLLVAGLGVTTASASTTAATSNAWTAAANNVQAPGYQTATVLPDGRVLAAGGQGTKAELFIPATGTWTVAASMNRSRAYATATLLPSGKVLLAGGYDGTAALASAELYDPATNRWTLTGSMALGRLQHSATLLGNGKVLVAGGTVPGSYWSATANAELYDPATGRFTTTGSMTRARAVFTLTLLLDGTVLAADYGATDLYDPTSGAFTPTAPLPTDIDAISAVRLTDGRVLAVGGTRGSTTAAEIYNPATRTWQAAASLNYDHYYAPWNEVLLGDGRVLVVGGFAAAYPPHIAEVWDPAAGFWTVTGQMANSRGANFGTVVLRDGRVLVDGGSQLFTWCDNEGGECYTEPLRTTEIYTP
jgi:Galactose oxidase, central domain/Kelch motif